ncbi:hypothetical protein F4212_12095 [Candidatus Poribacteria bacterium]|nr:hypothetical protein [Candidatus Poribacteria bacterium]
MFQSRLFQSVQLLCFLIFLFLLSAIGKVFAQETDSNGLINKAIRQQNLGLAYLEESQPLKAVKAFTELIELIPTEGIGYGNLAVAHLRLRQHDDAEQWVKRGIEVVPMDSHLYFILSEVYQVKGQTAQAIDTLKEAVKLAPEELEFRYKLAQHYLGQRNNPDAKYEAVFHLQELYQRTPVNVVILMKLTQALIGQDRLEDAGKHCQELLILLGDTDPDKLAYLTQGIDAIENDDQVLASRNLRIFENLHRASPRYQQGIGELVTNILGHPIESFRPGFKARIVAKLSPPIDVEFVDVTEQLGLLKVISESQEKRSVLLFDYNNDGILDIFTTSPATLFKNGDGKFVIDIHLPINLGQNSHNPNTVSYADMEKDGIQDILFDVLLPIDYDHDGDLDLLSNKPGLTLHRNNGEGELSDVSDQTFIFSDREEEKQRNPIEALAADFDDDGDIDIFSIHAEMGCTLYDNLRQGKFRAITSKIGISQDIRYTSVTKGDYDNDGDIDLFLSSTNGIYLYRNRGDVTFVIDKRSEDLLDIKHDAAQLKTLDYDNDGFMDLWVISKQGLLLFRNDGTGRFTDNNDIINTTPQNPKGIAGAVGDYDNDGDLDLFYINDKGHLRVLQNNGGNQNNWIQVRLEGVTSGNNKVNRDGIGSKLEVKVSDLYQMQYVSEQVSHFGLGAFDTADVVRVVWTNGVPQNVIEPKAKQRILEKQVLKGSCPFLYVYNGENYEFVTDLLWRAPLGLITSMGFVAPDETKDFVKISASKMRPKDGKYSIQITEELWETAYFDMVKLIAVDHPKDMDIYVDEQYIPPPFADFKIYGVSEKRFPMSVLNHKGEDVTDSLKTADYHYAIEHVPGPYQGVVEPHAIILDLGDIPDKQPITLFLNGWIFPTDTSINVALSQNPAINPSFPSVAVKDNTGKWKTVIEMIGIPAGKNKTITIDLTGKFLSEEKQVRIATNMQIYWDAAFFTVGEQDVPMVITELTPDNADLHYRGFSEMYRPNPHAPHLFDYQKVTKSALWRDLEGFYTRYGDVNPLLQEIDDMYVILNAGDEITVEFNTSRLPELKEGWKRDFILYSDGWDKDGDINTLTSQTVEPLPFHGMSKYPYPETEHFPDDETHQRYRLKYNTRRVLHELPKLMKK